MRKLGRRGAGAGEQGEAVARDGGVEERGGGEGGVERRVHVRGVRME